MAQRKQAKMKMTMENSAEEAEITMDDVRSLIKKKDDIEEEIKAYYEVLEDVSLCRSTLTHSHRSI